MTNKQKDADRKKAYYASLFVELGHKYEQHCEDTYMAQTKWQQEQDDASVERAKGIHDPNT